ncbi:hypothetical protein NQ315_016691 [Exocentrus adspersus]|uniref:Integrase p58-like C-terminal domain-containing protein n=1 Tax=Exocentrus adspersus TaxID=1586481 RepID=A0AAV8VEI4_9CUCU|nr:hypothetical protein NQ315_016691 [Exocentrus adspersus]
MEDAACFSPSNMAGLNPGPIGMLFNNSIKVTLDGRTNIVVKVLLDSISAFKTNSSEHRREREPEFTCRRTKLDGPEEWDTDTLAREQREDPDVGDIAQWKIEGQERPACQEISNRSPTFKGYWALWDSLAVENNLLKRVWESPDGKEKNYQTILPRKRVPEVLLAVHCGSESDFIGLEVDRMLKSGAADVKLVLPARDPELEVEDKCSTYRSAVHESTGKTPASVIFGAELRLPIELISDRPKKEEGVDNYISRLQDRLKLTHAKVVYSQTMSFQLKVQQKLKLESDRMKTRYDLQANTGGFQVEVMGGPYIVATRLNDVVYRIQKNPHAKMKIIHIDRLTPYQEPHPNEGVT